MNDIISTYIANIDKSYSTGESTEHSFRGDFCMLCKSILNASVNTKKSNQSETYQIINEPKRKEYGAPDYVVLKGDTAIAFIEAKNIGDSDLRGENDKKHKEQFDRYKKAISTIAFTDYMTIILYENGEETMSATIAKIENGHIVQSEDVMQFSNFEKVLYKLAQATPQPIKSARDLADKMARKAKLVANILHTAMTKNETKEDKELHGKLSTFQKHLVHDMKTEQFVDFYAQTILYGLFIARINDKTPQTFSLLEASELIPNLNPFLKKIFKELALANLHPFVKGIVEDLVLLFKVTDMGKVLRNYGKDPLVHFYEDFLEAYNPKIREEYGVWYTPVQVVRFIVESVDTILRKTLGIEDGLANNDMTEDNVYHKVQILDPAVGTGTFLAVTADKIYENYKGQEGLWDDDVVKHIIPRLNGFEYLMAPYTMAHLKLASSLKLEKTHTVLPDRLNIFLTNSLEEEHPEENFDFAKYITDESNAASVIKRETPIMVVMGNPPYNEKSANKGQWIMSLMDDYKQEPGMVKKLIRKKKDGSKVYKNTLDEVNAKGINNDYCKFIRLGHNFVKNTKEGVLAYICGNTFTQTNIFRGMRYELLKDFDDIYIINLHGSSKFAEDINGKKDENIFNIMVGVSINIFVKKKDGDKDTLATVHYKDVYGSRKEKLAYLNKFNLEDIDFEIITPEAPFYEMTKKSNDFQEKKCLYNNGFKIDQLFRYKVQGFKTEKDSVVILDSKQDVEILISKLVSDEPDNVLINNIGIKETRDWKLKKARDILKRRESHEDYFAKVCYRPFDYKWTYLDKAIVTYPRPLIEQSLKNKENQILCIGKQGTAIGKTEWSLVYMSPLPTDMNVNPRGGAYLFPIYLYDTFGKCYNFSQEIIQILDSKLDLHIQEENDTKRAKNGYLGLDLIDYIYAVLHSGEYRETYHDFLQNDFPTIPYPKDADYFFDMAMYGKQLREAHQLIGIDKKDFITQYPVSDGDNIVTMRKFEETEDGKGRVWINKYRYFDNVPTDAWNLFISGYQPLDKWLKDRNGKELSGDDIRHYQKIVVALRKTIDIKEKIDEIIEL